MSKGNVFNTTTQTSKSALENVKETLYVDADGGVSFKSTLGRGSGKPIQIPGNSFDEFVSLMQEVAEKRHQFTGTSDTSSENALTSDE